MTKEAGAAPWRVKSSQCIWWLANTQRHRKLLGVPLFYTPLVLDRLSYEIIVQKHRLSCDQIRGYRVEGGRARNRLAGQPHLPPLPFASQLTSPHQ